MPKTKRTHRVPVNGLCPCGSGRMFAECCWHQTGHIRKQPPSISPPRPVTGFQRQGCYLHATGDCSDDLSGEHYITKRVLGALGDRLTISGAHWQTPGESKEIGINSLTAKILCTRHNSCLSPLDDAAGFFFEKIQAARKDLVRKSLSRKAIYSIVSGEAIELWALKILCGMFYGKISSIDGTRVSEGYAFLDRLMLDALFENKWASGAGLYVKMPKGNNLEVRNALGVAPLLAQNERRVVGVQMYLPSIWLSLIIDPVGNGHRNLERDGWTFRPTSLLIEMQKRVHAIDLSWPIGTPLKAISTKLSKIRVMNPE